MTDPGRDAFGNEVGPRVDPLRLVIVHSHSVFVEALRERLSTEPDIEVVGTATDSRSALALVTRVSPHVVAFDVRVGDEDGLALGAELRELAPTTALVAVTSVDNPRVAVQAVRLGVRAWVPLNLGIDFLLSAVRAAPRGHSWFPPDLLGQLLPLLAHQGAANHYDEMLAELTDRERQILECMIDGLDRRSIAARLNLSANTVRTHVQRVLAKLQVHSSLEAVALALTAGWRGHDPDDIGADPTRPVPGACGQDYVTRGTSTMW
jgi:DNA-binding NarL/FixJ family response regulator